MPYEDNDFIAGEVYPGMENLTRKIERNDGSYTEYTFDNKGRLRKEYNYYGGTVNQIESETELYTYID